MRCAICDNELNETDYVTQLALLADTGRDYPGLCDGCIREVEKALTDGEEPADE